MTLPSGYVHYRKEPAAAKSPCSLKRRYLLDELKFTLSKFRGPGGHISSLGRKYYGDASLIVRFMTSFQYAAEDAAIAEALMKLKFTMIGS